MKKKSKYSRPDDGGIKKVWLALRITFALILFGAFAAHGAAHSQITLEMKGVELKKVLLTIERQTSFMFLYNKEDLDKAGKINVSLKGDRIGEILDACLKGTGLTYTIQDDVIVLRPRNPALTATQQGERMRITGKVTDRDGNPFAGVTVIIKGSNTGTMTDANGNFLINVGRGDRHPVLRFLFVGKITRETTVYDDRPLNIILEDDVAQVGEVVVTGYQTMNRADMVGSFTTLKVEDIYNPAFTTIDQMLQGQVAGMIVTRSSARAGTNPTIKIRGASTIHGNTDPIWVVDGVIQDDPIELNASSALVGDLKDILGNQISWLNPDDIATVTVLKDASATAVYGSRATNGVIVIKTKKAEGGKLSIGYSGTVSFEPKPNYGMFNLMNSQERILFADEMYNGGIRYLGVPVKQNYSYEGLRVQLNDYDISAEEFVARKNRLETINTDWLDLLTRTTFTQNHSLSLRGSTEKMNYSLSVGFSQQPGQEKGNDTERLTSRLAIAAQPTPMINIQATLNFSRFETNTFSNVNPLGYATSTSRALPAYNEDGSLAFYRTGNDYGYNRENETLGYNIIHERDNSGAKSNSGSFQTSLNFTWKLIDWLDYQFTGGYSHMSARNGAYSNEHTKYIANNYRGYDYGAVSADHAWVKAALLPFGGEYFLSTVLREGYNVQNKLLANKTFNEIHRINVMVAVEVRSTNTLEDANTLWGYLKDRGNQLNRPTLVSDFTPVGTGGSITDWGVFERLYHGAAKINERKDNYFSLFATAAYSLKNRYVFNATLRNDASNRFGQDVNKRFNPTYSLGLSWRVMQEPFFENRMQWLSDLNLDVTYGIQGNSPTQNPNITFAQLGIAPNFNEYYSNIQTIPNPNLSWESTKHLNTQVNMRLFDAVSLTVDYYWKRSNAIVSQNIPSENGKFSMSINGGIIYNEGIEGTISFSPVVTKDFGIRVSLNSSKNWNRGGKRTVEPKLSNYLSGTGDYMIRKGYPLGSFWSFAFDKLSSDTGAAKFKYIEMTEEEFLANPDYTRFLVYSGTSEPYFTGGLNLHIRYRSLTLSSQFSLLLGGRQRLPSPYAGIQSGIGGAIMPNEFANLSKDLTKRWKQSGDEVRTIYPELIQNNAGDRWITLPDGTGYSMFDMWALSDAMAVNSSFLRCRNISLGWNVNPELIRKLSIQSLNVSLSASNLFVIASKRFNGFDPELTESVMPRTFSLSVNLGF